MFPLLRPIRWLVAVTVPLVSLSSSESTSGVKPISFPMTVDKFATRDGSCSESSDASCDAVQASAMLQTRFDSGKVPSSHIASPAHKVHQSSKQAPSATFIWGVTPPHEHPATMGKGTPHPMFQEYEATPPHLGGMVLNIFSKTSNGGGGLQIALQTPNPCNAHADWVEVDRVRCSSKYPCSLRLPAGAVRGNGQTSTRFRTIVVQQDEDYGTDFIEYDRVTLDHDAVVTVAHEKFADDASNRILKFNLSPVLASGALSVTPIVEGATADTTVMMKLRQPEPTATSNLLKVSEKLSKTEREMAALDANLKSYRSNWAGEWRASAKAIAGCDLSLFEVVADNIYPGEMELEIWTPTGHGRISDVLVTTRVSWSEAEVSLLDSLMKDHFGYFNDPDVITHGLPQGAVKKGDAGLMYVSNPTEWGYAMQSWVVMAETGVLKPHETLGKLKETFQTMRALQDDPNQFAHGLFYPYYDLRQNGEKRFPSRTDYKEMPCGDDALLYASMMMIGGWLKSNNFHAEADECDQIIKRMDFSKCIGTTDCTGGHADGDKFWSVPLTFDADTMQPNAHNWNVWADEGGLVAMIVALTGAIDSSQYESIVRQQQRFSPCTHWEGITVGHAAFFNSVFTLPTRSMLGFGTLFTSSYYHEFTVRSVLPTFRSYQKLKKNLGLTYMGASDAMTMKPRGHPDKIFGSYAFWPPNNMYNCWEGRSQFENQCTWCKGVQYEGLEDPLSVIVPHGNMAAFLSSAMMEKSQFSSWLEDTKLLMTDASGIYKPGYGVEVVAPAKRTPPGGNFEGSEDGRGIWESLSTGYTILSMYEGLATMRRRFELVKQAGLQMPPSYEPPSYRPLSDFLDVLPEVRSKIDGLLQVAREQESQEKQCPPSDYGPPGQY